MAPPVTAIHDGCEAGALTGLLAGRYQVGLTAAYFANLVAEAAAIANEFITVNAAAIDDTSKVSIAQVVQYAAAGILMDRPAVTEVQPPVATDYAGVALQIKLAVQEAISTGGLA